MATIHVAVLVKNSMLAALQAAFDAGSGPATIAFYTGTMPTLTTDAVTTQTLLGTLTCSDPCGSTADGTLTFGSITQDSAADATGVATWARIKDSDGVVVADVDVTAIGNGGVIQLNTTSIVIGGPILLSSFKFSI